MKYRIIAFIVALVTPCLVVAALLGVDTLSTLRYQFDWNRSDTMYVILNGIEAALAFAAFLISAFLGWLLARKAPLPERYFSRYLPLLLPMVIALFASIPLLRAFSPSLVFVVVPVVFLAAVYIPFFLIFMVTSRRRSRSSHMRQGLARLGAIAGAALLAAGLNLYMITENTLYGQEYETVGHGVYQYDYMPFAEKNMLVTPDAEPSLKIEKNHPRLDGAIALLPIYGAVSQATYTGVDTRPYWEWYNDSDSILPSIYDVVQCNNTPGAWQRMVDGEIDVFFGVPPSEEQLQAAYAAGLTPVQTPIAKDAFVFMVNADNEVDGLSTAQIQDIYRKRITNWVELAGPDEKILAFQRPAGSGSQTTMEETVMAGLSMTSPLREEYMEGMGDIVNAVAEYRNRAEAIGYTFRWYATVQFPSDQIKFLAVDKISPTPENIAANTYPYTIPFVAVTCRPRSPETAALIEWILSPEGQALIAKTGYVPLNETERP